jgi:hypothetical protein
MVATERKYCDSAAVTILAGGAGLDVERHNP